MPTDTSKTDERTGINVSIPTPLHKRLRIKAVQQELTLGEAIEAAVKAWLR